MLKALAPIRDFSSRPWGKSSGGREGNFDTLFHCPIYGNYGSPDDKLTRPTRLSLFLFGVED